MVVETGDPAAGPPENTRVIITNAAWVRGGAWYPNQKKEWEAEVKTTLRGRPGRRWVLYDFYGSKKAVMPRNFKPDSWRLKDGGGSESGTMGGGTDQGEKGINPES